MPVSPRAKALGRGIPQRHRSAEEIAGLKFDEAERTMMVTG